MPPLLLLLPQYTGLILKYAAAGWPNTLRMQLLPVAPRRTLGGYIPNSSMTQYQPPLCQALSQLHRWLKAARAGAVASRRSISRRQLDRVRLSVNSPRPLSCTLRNTLAGS